jgi:hypothetical protein
VSYPALIFALHTLTSSGNQGTDFRYVPREGFGWMNAAYQVGLQFLSIGMRRAVAACVPVSVDFAPAETRVNTDI